MSALHCSRGRSRASRHPTFWRGRFSPASPRLCSRIWRTSSSAAWTTWPLGPGWSGAKSRVGCRAGAGPRPWRGQQSLPRRRVGSPEARQLPPPVRASGRLPKGPSRWTSQVPALQCRRLKRTVLPPWMTPALRCLTSAPRSPSAMSMATARPTRSLPPPGSGTPPCRFVAWSACALVALGLAVRLGSSPCEEPRRSRGSVQRWRALRGAAVPPAGRCSSWRPPPRGPGRSRLVQARIGASRTRATLGRCARTSGTEPRWQSGGSGKVQTTWGSAAALWRRWESAPLLGARTPREELPMAAAW
mmetsp:Transcript_82356/g.245623  ORF Transcript_82356/g.245623 Transcript_82356/m.245623 type:complete len:303 (-) Transcript_82356:806-1714(-)